MTKYTNPQPWSLAGGRWVDAAGDVVPLSPEDDRKMLLAHIADDQAYLSYERARAATADNVSAKEGRRADEYAEHCRLLDDRGKLLAEQVIILREAVQGVIDAWESGDLAGAVRKLSVALEATTEKRR